MGALERRFRERLNDDLDVAGAIAAVTEEVERLHRRREALSPGERAGARQGLRAMDSVLRVLCPGEGR
jgi:cysteinyl-tRNA synthetase